MPAGKHTQWADDVRTPESRSPVPSGKSFTSKHGKGFFMADLVNAAHRVAGLDHTSVAYIPGYAEENVHRLITTLLDYDQAKSLDELSVVFIGNSTKQIQLWCQKSAEVEDRNSGFKAREFHAILVQKPPASDELRLGPGEAVPAYVWDLDSTLPLPCRLSYYAHNALRLAAYAQFDEKYSRFYRVVPAAAYLENFASDRTHMRLATGEFKQPPPPWPCITTPDGRTSTVPRYWDLYMPPTPWQEQDASCPWGRVLEEGQLLPFFQTHNTPAA
ncbi:N-terminal glutamine amidase-domain-containing protein [Haematococcus lacustris]